MDSPAGHAAAFAAGAALGAAALYLYTRHEWSQQTAAPPAAGDGTQQAAAAVPSAAASSPPANGSQFSMAEFEQDEVLEEQLTRNVQFFGLPAQKRIGGSFVVVVGLGVSWRQWRQPLLAAPSAPAVAALELPGLGASGSGSYWLCGTSATCHAGPGCPNAAAAAAAACCRAWARMRRTCCCGREWGACA